MRYCSIVALMLLLRMSVSKTSNTVRLIISSHHFLMINSITVRAVINETLRLFPPVPLNVRESRSSCALPPFDPSYPDPTNDRRPLYMPGNITITYLPLLTQRNKALWGPDADEFDPERWLQPDRIARFVANPAMFAPFSAGPRIVSSFSLVVSA
jgi:cytochrome P450